MTEPDDTPDPDEWLRSLDPDEVAEARAVVLTKTDRPQLPAQQLNHVPAQPDTAPASDPMGDVPLLPPWARSSAGWKARSKVGALNSRRAWRRWLRRQHTAHGHTAQVWRGIARTARWVHGVDGAQVDEARRGAERAQAAHKHARHELGKRLIPGEKKQTLAKRADAALEDATAAMNGYRRAKKDARKARAWRAAGILTPVTAAEAGGLIAAGGTGAAVASGGLAVVLGLIGRRTDAGETYNDRDRKIGDGDKMNDAMIDRAFREAGVIKGEQAVLLRSPAMLDVAGAWRVDLQLKGGPGVKTTRARHEELADAFGIPPYQLDIIDSADGRGDHFTLWVATSNPFAETFVSPLVNKPAQTDAFGRGVLIGYNRRREPIHLRMGHVMGLLGGASRTGKGMLLRNVVCGLGLDPTVNLRLVAGAKPGEHAGYAPVCATFFGRDPQRLVALLEALLREGQRREDILANRKKAKASARDLEEFPLEVLIIDEFKQYAGDTTPLPDPSDPDKTVKAGDRIAELLEQLAAFVAALNITVWLSTQDPDANTIPRGFKSNSIARIATRTQSPTQTNAILKEGATGAGMRAHEIPKSLKGTSIVDIDGHDGDLIRSCFIEDDKYDGAADIIAAGEKLRREAGRAPGQFADPIEFHLAAVTGLTSVAGGQGGFGRPSPVDGDEDADGGADVLDHLIKAAEATGRGEITRAELFAYLGEHWSAEYVRGEDETDSQYGAKAGKRFAAELAEAGVKLTVGKVQSADGRESRGYRLDSLREAVERAEGGR